MGDFYQADQDVTQQNNAGGDINVAYYISHPFEAVKELVGNVSNLFQNMLPEVRNDYSRAIQVNEIYDNKIEEIAIRRKEIGLKIMRLENDTYYQNQILDYQNQILQLKEYQVRLEREKFEYEKLNVQEKLALMQNFYTESIEIKKRELRDKNDYRYLNLQVSRDDVIEILSRESGNLVIIPSPPEVLCDDLPAFNSLRAEIPYNLEQFIEGQYAVAAYSAINCKNIFRDPIDKLVASTVGSFITPIPTLIFHTKITHDNILVGITITCPEAKIGNVQTDELQTQSQNWFIPKSCQKSLPKWKWREFRNKLEAEGKNCDESSQDILEIISTMHLIVTLFFCDLYSLQLNPNHSPQLLTFLLRPVFPDVLRPWAEHFRVNLEEAQRQIREELNRLRALQSESEKYIYTDIPSSSGDFGSAQLVALGIGAMFLFAMCSQPALNTVGNDVIGNNQNTNQFSGIEKGLFIVVKNMNGSGANIRTGPSTNYEVILTVPPEFKTSVKSIDETSGWIEIDMTQHHPSYKTGWIAGNLVDIYETR